MPHPPHSIAPCTFTRRRRAIGSHRLAGAHAAVKGGIRFLIVDDDRTLRESCANLLQLDGYTVSVAGRGHEALELLRHRRFDIVLLDLYMSDVSGYELLRVAMETSPRRSSS